MQPLGQINRVGKFGYLWFRRRTKFCPKRVLGNTDSMIRAMLVLVLACSVSWAQDGNGSAIFERSCAGCHRPNSGTRAPLPEVLRQMSRDTILRALVSGKMKFQGDSLNEAERAAVVAYLGISNDPAAQTHAVGSRRRF